MLEAMLSKTATAKIVGHVFNPIRQALELLAYLALEAPVSRDRAAKLLYELPFKCELRLS